MLVVTAALSKALAELLLLDTLRLLLGDERVALVASGITNDGGGLLLL